jgi:hypothetical protein
MIINNSHASYNQPSFSQHSNIQQNSQFMNYQMAQPPYNQQMFYNQGMYTPMYMPYGMNFTPIGMPPSFNPHMLMNQPPINNYNKNIFNNESHKPIKITHHTESEISNLKRAVSSKNKGGDNSQIEYNTNPNNDSRRRNTSNYDGTYRPYSLKEYKQLASAKIVMGSLGPNIGTKEWEQKQEKMKKMGEYANSINTKVVIKVKKEDPFQIIEKEKKDKIENSNRYKAYEYSKLVRPRSKTHFNNDFLPSINSENNSKQIYDNSIDNYRYNDNSPQINILQKKRENYKFNIDEIKESLLK